MLKDQHTRHSIILPSDLMFSFRKCSCSTRKTVLYAGLTNKSYCSCCREERLEAFRSDCQFSQPKAPGKGIILLDVLSTLPKPDLGVLLTPCCTLLLPKEVFASFLELR